MKVILIKQYCRKWIKYSCRCKWICRDINVNRKKKWKYMFLKIFDIRSLLVSLG